MGVDYGLLDESGSLVAFPTTTAIYAPGAIEEGLLSLAKRLFFNVPTRLHPLILFINSMP